METLISRLKSTIARHRLFSRGEHVLVGVSGGADSVCLLIALKKLAPSLQIKLTVAHLNHGIRRQGAAADESFVRELSASIGVPLVTQRMNVHLRARRASVSLEMAAREARYSFFSTSARRVGADVAATAHTSDDQAETVLLKLARGAGATGLSGIARETVVQGIRVVRPLLDVTHRQACAFLRSRGVAWREDETNRNTAFLRNRVRHDILPLLEKTLNPSIRETLARTADIISAEDHWLAEISRAAIEECRGPDGTLSVSNLREYRPAARRRVLMLWLAEVGASTEHVDFNTIERVDALLEGRTGKMVRVDSGLAVQRSYDRLMTAEYPADEIESDFREALPVPGEIILPQAGLRIQTTLAPGIEKPRGETPGHFPVRASISKSAVGRKRLYVRFRRPGDRMRPHGVRGSRKLQDIFTDAKVPRALRSRIPLVECGGEIVWIPGYRIARGWEVCATQKNAIQICAEAI